MRIRKFNEEKKDDNVEIFKELYDENPLKDTHDFYFFIGKDAFIEQENGFFKKGLEIENMVRMTPDAKSISAGNGMSMRVRFQQDSVFYHIWLPKEIRKEVEGKGSNSIEPWLVELINKHKQRGADEHGKEVYRDVLQRREDIKKYNL